MAKIGNEDIFLTDTGGDKPALLFVHGLTFDRTVWQSQVGAFSVDFRVVCVDLRGHGRSTAANPDISFEDHAADLAMLIDTLGLKDVTLVGWSMGGAIAQLFAATYFGKISHLVLVGSTPQLLADDKFKHALPPEGAQELATLMAQDYAKGCAALCGMMERNDQRVTAMLTAIVNLAFEEPDLSPRELAVNFTDTKGSFVSEASVYRLLKDHGLITSPAFILMKAADRFAKPTTAPNQLWQTDFTYLKVIGWGWFYSVYRARRLLALHPGLEAVHDHGGHRRGRYTAGGAEG